MEQPQTLSTLFQKYLENQCTPSEFDELLAQFGDESNNDIKAGLINQQIVMGMSNTGYDDAELKEHLIKRLEHILQKIDTVPKTETSVFQLRWFRIAAAAVFILLASGGYFLFFDKTSKQNQVVKNTDPASHDVKAPTGTKARITLADGRTVALDSITSGMLAIQGNVKVLKNTNGDIVYSEESGTRSQETQYNTLYNPRGSKVASITLIDGTKVWLNAESSLKYFTSLGSKERKVEITGEAYFEVAHNNALPFKVRDVSREVEVQVLGTHFNVSAYSDEASLKVTLLEGSIKVIRGPAVSILKPGQQAVVLSDINVVNAVDVDAVTAWKNGYFQFQESDIKTIMRQVTRWYDVEVMYEGEIPTGHFNGKPSRDLSAVQMLKILEYSGVKIKIEGKKIVVIK